VICGSYGMREAIYRGAHRICADAKFPDAQGKCACGIAAVHTWHSRPLAEPPGTSWVTERGVLKIARSPCVAIEACRPIAPTRCRRRS